MAATLDTVSIIGIGEMGAPITGHAVAAGYDVYAYDVADDARDRASSRGATLVDSPGEAAARADLTLVLVGTSEQVESVLRDEDAGVFAHAADGHLVVIGSTLSPEECIAYAELGAEEGVSVVDAPSCRGGGAAEAGELLVLCGGDSAAVERASPLLETFAAPGDLVHLGDVGAGQVGKMANNTLLWASLVADYEVLSLARAYGLDLGQLRDVLTRSSGDNWALHEWDWLHTKWAHKDMAITMEMADRNGQVMPLAGLVRQLVRDIDVADLDELR